MCIGAHLGAAHVCEALLQAVHVGGVAGQLLGGGLEAGLGSRAHRGHFSQFDLEGVGGGKVSGGEVQPQEGRRAGSGEGGGGTLSARGRSQIGAR